MTADNAAGRPPTRFIAASGWIDVAAGPKVLMLGDRKVAQYLVAGTPHAIVGGGVAWHAGLFEEQLDRHGIDRDAIGYLIVSHVHHDHCGLAPYLSRRYPHIEMLASPYGAHLLAKPEVAGVMDSINSKTLEHMGLGESHDGVSLGFEPLEGVRPMEEGDELGLGEGATLKFMPTPGHSRCSMSVYLPEAKMLFPGDSLPLWRGADQKPAVAANHDFNDYVASLEKLSRLAVEAIAYEHGGVLLAPHAAGEAARGLDAARSERERIRKRYEELGEDFDLLVEDFAEKYARLELFGAIDRPRLQAILSRMLASALAR